MKDGLQEAWPLEKNSQLYHVSEARLAHETADLRSDSEVESDV